MGWILQVLIQHAVGWFILHVSFNHMDKYMLILHYHMLSKKIKMHYHKYPHKKNCKVTKHAYKHNELITVHITWDSQTNGQSQTYKFKRICPPNLKNTSPLTASSGNKIYDKSSWSRPVMVWSMNVNCSFDVTEGAERKTGKEYLFFFIKIHKSWATFISEDNIDHTKCKIFIFRSNINKSSYTWIH